MKKTATTVGHDHNGGLKSEYHHGVKQSNGRDIPVSIPVSVLTHVYIHLSIISRSTCGSIGASALARYQRYTGWSYLTSPLYRQFNFRNPSPPEVDPHMLMRRTQRAFVPMAYDCRHPWSKHHVDLARIHCR